MAKPNKPKDSVSIKKVAKTYKKSWPDNDSCGFEIVIP